PAGQPGTDPRPPVTTLSPDRVRIVFFWGRAFREDPTHGLRFRPARDRVRPGRSEGGDPGREARPPRGGRRAPTYGRRRVHEHRDDSVEDTARGRSLSHGHES